jgi:hypothetical protein
LLASLQEAEPMLRQALAAANSQGFPLLPWQRAEIEHALGLCVRSLHQPEGEQLLLKSRLDLRGHPRPAFRGEAPLPIAIAAH